VFDSGGKFLRKFGSYGSENGQLSAPVGVIIIKSTTPGRRFEVAVADSNNNRVQVFSTQGDFLWYTADDGEDKFKRPRFLGVASDGDILVADDNHAVWFSAASEEDMGAAEEKAAEELLEPAIADDGEGDSMDDAGPHSDHDGEKEDDDAGIDLDDDDMAAEAAAEEAMGAGGSEADDILTRSLTALSGPWSANVAHLVPREEREPSS